MGTAAAGLAAMVAGGLVWLTAPGPASASPPGTDRATAADARPGRAAAGRVPVGWAPAGSGARVLCRITDRRIGESSGLAVAGDRLYTADDGGDRLRVFVLDLGCRVRRVIESPVNPYDVEDLARGADGTLWLADIGDNEGVRRTVAVELLTESGEATLFRFSYPDGPHDAEALLLDRHGRPYLVTKEPLSTGVYTPAGTPSTGRPTPLRRVTTLRFAPTGTPGGPVGAASQVLVTGGAVAPDGTRLALRTYTDAYVWSVPDGDVAAALRSDRPERIPLPATAQGEGIAFSADGRSLLTSTEGLPAPVHVVPLNGDPPTDPPATAAPTARATGSAGGPSSGGGSSLGNAAVAALVATALIWGGGRLLGAVRR